MMTSPCDRGRISVAIAATRGRRLGWSAGAGCDEASASAAAGAAASTLRREILGGSIIGVGFFWAGSIAGSAAGSFETALFEIAARAWHGCPLRGRPWHPNLRSPGIPPA